MSLLHRVEKLIEPTFSRQELAAIAATQTELSNNLTNVYDKFMKLDWENVEFISDEDKEITTIKVVCESVHLQEAARILAADGIQNIRLIHDANQQPFIEVFVGKIISHELQVFVNTLARKEVYV